jgi:AcrR family transcriptional regulator
MIRVMKMDAIEQKMIEKTIDSIEKYGIENVTIRLIAREAGVNSAAVSYYFRSKENLVAIALKTALENAFEWSDFKPLEQSDARALLKAVLGFLADGALKFPNLTKAFITDAFLKEDYSGAAIEKINAFGQLVLEKLRPLCPEYDENTLRLIVHQAFACGMLQFMTLPRCFDAFLGDSLADDAFRTQYIDSLVDRLLPPA